MDGPHLGADVDNKRKMCLGGSKKVLFFIPRRVLKVGLCHWIPNHQKPNGCRKLGGGR